MPEAVIKKQNRPASLSLGSDTVRMSPSSKGPISANPAKAAINCGGKAVNKTTNVVLAMPKRSKRTPPTTDTTYLLLFSGCASGLAHSAKVTDAKLKPCAPCGANAIPNIPELTNEGRAGMGKPFVRSIDMPGMNCPLKDTSAKGTARLKVPKRLNSGQVQTGTDKAKRNSS